MIIECLFFILCSVFLYGIGLNRAVIISSSPKGLALSFMKSLFATVSTVALSYLVIQNLLVPLALQELFPLVSNKNSLPPSFKASFIKFAMTARF